MSVLQDFIHVVTQSTLLTRAQKKEFLDKPEMLPEEYREKIIGILGEFDRKTKARVKRVKSGAEQVLKT